MRDKIPPTAEKQVAAKTTEAIGLVMLLKPLLKRAGGLTKAEQDMLLDTVLSATCLLNEATTIIWNERCKPDTSKAIAKVGE